MAQKNLGVVAFLCVIAVALVINVAFTFYAIPNEVTADVDLSKVESGLVALATNDAVLLSKLDNLSIEKELSGDYVVTESEYEDDVTDDKALELATESIESRDFKKAVFDALEDYGVEIEDYKDITEIKVLDSDVDGDEVTFDIKVYYFLDGDDDEDERARFDEFTVTVDDLDFDDDFEDAEVDDSYMDTLSVAKVYN